MKTVRTVEAVYGERERQYREKNITTWGTKSTRRKSIEDKRMRGTWPGNRKGSGATHNEKKRVYKNTKMGKKAPGVREQETSIGKNKRNPVNQ